MPTLDEKLMQALTCHQSGNLTEARAGYREILRLDPQHVNALHLHGLVCHQSGDHQGAIADIERAIALCPGEAAFHNNLGEAHRALGQADTALANYRQAVRIDPRYAVAYHNLANVLRDSGRLDEATATYVRALEIDPNFTEAHKNLGIALQRSGRTDDAIRSLQHAAQLAPADSEAAHLLASLTGDISYQPSAEYLRRLFDKHAAQYDAQSKAIRYSVPNRLREAIDRTGLLRHRNCRILDLGCGTGMGAVPFRGMTASIAGVDLSPQMILQAQARGIHEELKVGDLSDTLTQRQECWNLLLGADVFVYIGDLESILRACGNALRPGGLLAFSTEHCDAQPIRLFPTGRFGHSPAYVARLADRTGLCVLSCDLVVGRFEGGRPRDVRVFVLQKTASARS